MASRKNLLDSKKVSCYAISLNEYKDITPYENKLYHLNTIMQPCTLTKAPVVGVAITAESGVPGCATGANQIMDIEMAARFVIEVAKSFTERKCRFYDQKEFDRIVKKYGAMNHLQET